MWHLFFITCFLLTYFLCGINLNFFGTDVICAPDLVRFFFSFGEHLVFEYRLHTLKFSIVLKISNNYRNIFNFKKLKDSNVLLITKQKLLNYCFKQNSAILKLIGNLAGFISVPIFHQFLLT